MKSLQGHFLVASPHLRDSNFYRSVVLMAQHDEEGAFGLALTRVTGNSVREVWELLGAGDCQVPDLIRLGGPVEGPLMALHADPACSENEIVPGLHLATQREYLNRLVGENRQPLRLFSGYSGWGPGQLDRELLDGGWLTTPATAGLAFSDPETLWERLSRHIGLEIYGPEITRHLPGDPSLN